MGFPLHINSNVKKFIVFRGKPQNSGSSRVKKIFLNERLSFKIAVIAEKII